MHSQFRYKKYDENIQAEDKCEGEKHVYIPLNLLTAGYGAG
jgi:hypothetical protein